MGAADAVDGPRIRVLDVLGWAEGLRLVGRPVGLDRSVRWAQATDLIDPSPYLRGEELVLVTGLSLRDAAACAEFVRALVPARPAAIGYAVGVVHEAAPDTLVHCANEAGTPVFEIPPTVPFVHFTERLARERVAHGERTANGHLLDLIRRGHARPDALAERAPALAGAHQLGVVAMSARDAVGVPTTGEELFVGTVDERVVVVHPAGTPLRPDRGTYGTSGPGRTDDLPMLIEHALSALALAVRRGAPATAAELVSIEALAQCLPGGYLRLFRQRLHEPLVRYDRAHHACLVDTLRMLIDCGGSVASCARRMYVHPNTVRKRLARIRGLTDKDPAVPLELAVLALALPDPPPGEAPVAGHPDVGLGTGGVVSGAISEAAAARSVR
ncbi:PucR family transcriptional regulator [Prauserella rugosa]|uniref:PucR-like helix-turn-helix protein n=1 Tax=Prauserella rugosa TaxID=43354 RepID=A0A660CD32_9PSEU|nr:PucR family transcriptional regulator [Prauserella rugosa]TWH19399.1 PucR-like helix-turn-helix protein [Prauserella rugosa]